MPFGLCSARYSVPWVCPGLGAGLRGAGDACLLPVATQLWIHDVSAKGGSRVGHPTPCPTSLSQTVVAFSLTFFALPFSLATDAAPCAVRSGWLDGSAPAGAELFLERALLRFEARSVPGTGTSEALRFSIFRPGHRSAAVGSGAVETSQTGLRRRLLLRALGMFRAPGCRDVRTVACRRGDIPRVSEGDLAAACHLSCVCQQSGCQCHPVTAWLDAGGMTVAWSR